MFSKRLVVIGTILLTLIIAVVLLVNSTSLLSSKPQVAASIFPVYDIARNIAGDKMNVVYLLPAGASEHTFEPSLAEQRAVAASKVVFVIGEELDNWAVKLADSSGVPTLALSESIELKESAEKEEHTEEETKHEHGEHDPHYWLSITNARQIATNIATKLTEIDPQHKDYYAQNLAAYQQKLQETYSAAKAKLADIKSNQIITFHEAFAYFADELGLEVVATIEPFPGKEPTISYLQEVGQIIKAKNVKVLFKEPQLSDNIISPLANDYQAEIRTLDPIGGLDGRNSYIDTYLYNVETIAEALD
jgi:ABC-type Zn uptake system ZnuABC Zn-binding protein ZnuA